MLLNGPVTLIAIAEITAKASHREIAVTIRRLELVDVSKLARGDERHSQTIHSRKRGSQHRVCKTDGGTLDGLGKIPRRRPVLWDGPRPCWRKRH
jgi:hypothetical protein